MSSQFIMSGFGVIINQSFDSVKNSFSDQDKGFVGLGVKNGWVLFRGGNDALFFSQFKHGGYLSMNHSIRTM